MFTHNQLPYLKSLTSCLKRVITNGYSHHFKATPEGIFSQETNKVYSPEEIRKVNFFRFEGMAQVPCQAIMYLIETFDGQKGTLVSPLNGQTDPLLDRLLLRISP